MDDFDYRHDECELSIASIARLNKLRLTLEAAANLPKGPLPNRGLALERIERLLLQRPLAHPQSLIISPEYESVARKLVTSIEEALVSLTGFLRREWERYQTRVSREKHDHFDGWRWSLGTIVYRLERRSVLRGDVELCKTEPIGANIPELLVQYLVTVPGTRDQLTREKHGYWGYHYHYLDDRDRRSDTLLTFDCRVLNIPRPILWWERHAERQKFKARADMWGTDKRKSVYSVCFPDVLRFSLQDFKRPKTDAKIVWP